MPMDPNLFLILPLGRRVKTYIFYDILSRFGPAIKNLSDIRLGGCKGAHNDAACQIRSDHSSFDGIVRDGESSFDRTRTKQKLLNLPARVGEITAFMLTYSPGRAAEL